LKIFRRSVQPGRGCVVCSCHFKNGLRFNGPELLEHLKKNVTYNFASPEKRQRNQKKAAESMATNMASNEMIFLQQNALKLEKYARSIIFKKNNCQFFNMIFIIF
jgi:hypothetical protein